MQIFKTIENEIQSYLTGQVPISEGYRFSQYALVKRIMLYANCIYPTGKLDSQDNYKYWFDVSTPRIDSEVKNIDFDLHNIMLYSDSEQDALAIFLATANMKIWMRETGQAIKLNDAIEESTGWGNVVWKKVKGGYDMMDLKDFYVVNQTARTLEDSPVIERHPNMTQSDLRAKIGIWRNVEEVIKTCGNKEFSSAKESPTESKETPYYEIHERNGEISEADLFEAQGKEGGNGDKYLLAKIVVAGLSKGAKESGKYILYADKLSKMPYKEYHRGRYTGRWFRVGIYEILFDIQTRANEIGNQIARGLEAASKTIFRSGDRIVAQNVMTDMLMGDIVKSKDLEQVQVRMQGLDQLIADWNRLMKLADDLCNSYEIVKGETMPSGTPFRLGALLDINASKLFEFIREKLGLAIQGIFEEWILPDLIKDLRSKKILRLTGDTAMLKRYYEMVVNGWYLKNLLAIGPHNAEQADTLKQKKMEEIQARPEALVGLEEKLFEGVKMRASVIITGENINLMAELETLHTFISLETDPVRRQALIEKAMRMKGIDVEGLPKSSPEELAAGAMPRGAPARITK